MFFIGKKCEVLLTCYTKDAPANFYNFKYYFFLQIVDVMISLWKRKEEGTWGHHRENVDDLELMKLNLNSDPPEEVDDQMDKLLSELQSFSIK